MSEIITTFKTYSLMIASTLADDAYALVIDDDMDDKNGYYQKRTEGWFYLKYNPSLKIKSIEKDIYGTESIPVNPVYEMKSGGISPDGVLIEPSNNGYQYSSPIFIPKNAKITFDYHGYYFCALTETNEDISIYNPLISVGYTGYDVSGKAEYTATRDNYVIICSNVTLGALNVVVEYPAHEVLFLPKMDIINDFTAGGEKKASSAELSKILKSEISAISDYISTTKPINIESEVGGFRWAVGVQITEFPVQGKEVTLAANDVLTFDYTPIDGVTLWLWGDTTDPGDANKGFPLLSSSNVSAEVKSYIFNAIRPTTLRIVNSITGTIKVNSVTPSITDLGAWGITQYPDYYPFTQLKRTNPFKVKNGDLITITNPSSGAISIVRQATNGQYKSVVAQSIRENNNTKISWRADANLTIMLSGKTNSEFLINHAGVSLDQKLESFAPSASTNYDVPLNIVLPEKEYVFATAMNYILKTQVIDGVDYIKISQDLGKTWTQMPNILGDIVCYHFFVDGTIMLCSPTKVYWTRDYLTLNESTVYDHDGSFFVPTGRHFFAMQTSDTMMRMGSRDVFVWGDYVVDATPVRIWYSTDQGRTIKCAAKFGTTVMDGAVRSVRHIHRVYQLYADGSLYITTGDNGNECMIMRAVYDITLDIWTWKVLAAGDDYKFGNIIIDDHFAYIVTDYTQPFQADSKGVYRVALADIGDITKYQLVYKAQASEWGAIAPVSLILDKNGNKVILPDYLGAGFIWVARDGLDFKKVAISPAVLLAYTIGTNYKGDIYCVAYNNSGELNTPDALKLNRGTYNITKALRDAGIDNFMRGTLMIHGLTNVF